MTVSKEELKNSVTIRDNRTGKTITVPITNNSIPATAFKALKAPYAPGEREENDTPYGLRVHDPAFLNTTALESKITYIDGEKGTLRHRGYPIEQLAHSSDYLEVAYLLIYGELPSKSQSELWKWEISHHTFVAEDLMRMMSFFRYDAHPMSIFLSTFAAHSAFSPEANPALAGQNLYKIDKATMNKQIVRIIGKAATIASFAMRIRMGRPFVMPRSDLSYTENMLYMMDSMFDEHKPDPRLAKALDVLFILHADHEMNCSTSTMTHVGSSLVDPYTCIAAAAGALYGPLHGGANEAVIRMLQQIGTVDKVPAFIESVKQKKSLLFGFGHRIYKTTDPRSRIVREVADTVFDILGEKEPLIEVALALRDQALADPYFIEKKLSPNIDFFSGLIYKAMGFPTDFFPVLFAVPRVSGWLAHWKQQIENPAAKIARPRQVYTGSGQRDFVPIDQRPDRDIKNGVTGLKEIPHYMSKRRFIKPRL